MFCSFVHNKLPIFFANLVIVTTKSSSLKSQGSCMTSEIPSTVGLTIEEINLRLPNSTAIGIVRNDEPFLNPGRDCKVETGDQVILITKDDGQSVLGELAAVDTEAFEREPNIHEEPHTLLILGFSDMLKQVLLEDDAYAAPGSKVIIAAEEGKIDYEALPDQSELSNITLDIRECKIFKRRVLERLVSENPTSILLLSDPDLKEDDGTFSIEVNPTSRESQKFTDSDDVIVIARN